MFPPRKEEWYIKNKNERFIGVKRSFLICLAEKFLKGYSVLVDYFRGVKSDKTIVPRLIAVFCDVGFVFGVAENKSVFVSVF